MPPACEVSVNCAWGPATVWSLLWRTPRTWRAPVASSEIRKYVAGRLGGAAPVVAGIVWLTVGRCCRRGRCRRFARQAGQSAPPSPQGH
jgi:hypothetical protein